MHLLFVLIYRVNFSNMYLPDGSKLSSEKKPAMHTGLFDRIISAINQEQEFRNSRKLFFLFFILLIISVSSAPFSWSIMTGQIKYSGVYYFISVAISDLGSFFAFWQDFLMAIVESLPIIAIIIFTINIALALFTLRLFLYKKQFLFRYLAHNFKVVQQI